MILFDQTNQLTSLMKQIFSKPLFIAVALLVITLFGIAGFHYEIGYPTWVTMLLGVVIGAFAVALIQLLLHFIAPWLKKIPASVIISIATGFLALYVMRMYAFRWPAQVFYVMAVIGFVCSLLLVIGIEKLIKGKNLKLGGGMIVMAIAFAALGFYGFNSLEGDPYIEDLETVFNEAHFLSNQGLENPAAPGSFEVESFTYGSGTDKKRPEYAEGVKYKTPTVDASLMLPEWEGKKKKWREKFWGFSVDSFPLNGRVHMPKGVGPFPIVLMVHGNHSMIDFSDAGYAYLGELLASKGVIAVSVDENFINAHWSGDFRGKEMPTRGWMLLKHLEQWKKWNQNEPELKGKIDLDKVVLMGHSRGGEAVSIAAAFNTLDRFPDNGNEKFDFNFGIKGIITVAPTDYRYDREISLKDINYLSLQGAYDSDETSFWGMRPFHRMEYSEDFNGFKAGLYMNHANHGQFNSTWGRSDFGAPMKWLLNLEPLVSGDEQREVAKVYISAFVESVLKDNDAYLPMFQNVDLVMDWLPKEQYISQYADTQKQVLVNFEKDIDVTTDKGGVKLSAENFKVWKEKELLARDGGSQQNNALVLGWTYAGGTTDSIPVYSIALTDSIKDFASSDTLAFSMAIGDVSELKIKDKDKKKSKPTNKGFNFSVVLVDSLGNKASVAIDEHNSLSQKIKSKFTKFKFLDKQMMGNDSETQLKSCYIPISSFLKQEDSLKLNNLKSIDFVFDKDTLGVIVLDDIGFYAKD